MCNIEFNFVKISILRTVILEEIVMFVSRPEVPLSIPPPPDEQEKSFWWEDLEAKLEPPGRLPPRRMTRRIPNVMRATIDACVKGDLKELTYLIEKKMNLNQSVAAESWRPLHFAACVGSMVVTRILVCCRDVELNALTDDGSTPLFLACQHGHHACVRWLLAGGADPNITDSGGRSALIIAAANENRESILVSLLANHADVSIRDRHGMTALSYAIARGDAPSVALLLHAGADAKQRSASGISALHCAVWRGNETIVRYLISHGASPSDLDRSGKSPCEIAIVHGNVKCLAVLLGAGARVDMRLIEIAAQLEPSSRIRECVRMLLLSRPESKYWAIRVFRHASSVKYADLSAMILYVVTFSRIPDLDLVRAYTEAPVERRQVLSLVILKRRRQWRIALDMLILSTASRRDLERTVRACDAACARKTQLGRMCTRCLWLRLERERLRRKRKGGYCILQKLPTDIWSLVFGAADAFLPVWSVWVN